ncbi:hypothetical protein G9F73_012945 [Clostridium estertheticum]|uniref:DUF7305 domain-containing protein n=1 Tax=Clostridium estertheticum TaxID=238834 RepID=UPI0013EE723F|nr:hypothetical protein [Clostridium estertheticum]MBZ9608715.1 hypothetical protein [Clostridium estertheticum]
MSRSRNIKLQKHKGSSLLLVIAIVGVLLILCPALGTSVVWEANNARNQEKKTQAYYIARAGAEAAAKYIESMNSKDVSTLVSQLPLHSDNTIFGNGNFNITIPTITDGKLLIKSTGKVNNGKDSGGSPKYITDTVTVVLKNTISPTIITTAIFANSSIILNGGSVDGDIGTNSIAANSIKYYKNVITSGHKIIIPNTGNNGELEGAVVKKQGNWIKLVPVENSPNTVVGNYPTPVMPSFPNGLANMGNITINGASSVNISTDGCYEKIEILDDTTLTINTSTGDRNIRIKNLNMKQGKIVITGGNKVNLYVDYCINLKGYVNSDGKSNGDKNKLQFYCNNTTPFTMAAETHIYGSVTWGTGEIILTGSGAIIGNLTSIGTSILFDGGSFLGSQILYAPNADITLNSGKITGAVIGNTVTVTNSGFVIKLPSNLPSLSVNSDRYEISYWK